MALSKEQILTQTTLPIEEVKVSGWPDSVFVRTLRATERDQFEASLSAKKGKPADLSNVRGKFAALVLCDEEGRRLFTDFDAPMLGRLSAKALDRIMDAGRVLNGMAPESVEEAEKNSESGPSAASSSSSPPISAVPSVSLETASTHPS